MSSAVVVAIAMLAGGIASADMSKNVISAFRGQLVITKGELPEGKNDADTIKRIKAERLTSITGETSDEVTSWNFHYTAFLNKTGASSLKMEFYKDGKTYSADKRLDGIDPKSGVLTGDIQINEDEGLTKGKSYMIKLVSGSTTVASTTLLMK
ncbi:MAG TPA: hypothetical protein VFQ53_01860 [Kofleriaceae bacterium]|nr:hypothetical protein [Kofleriaceae bacterium]